MMMMCLRQRQLHNLTAKGFTLMTSSSRNTMTHSICKSLPSSYARFSTSTKSISTATTTASKAPILGLVFLLTALSDPIISIYENSQPDVNVSYWKSCTNASRQNETQNEDNRCRLRNATKHFQTKHYTTNTKDSSIHSPPSYSRIVIVGGGMAGLHTALCLAERMDNPDRREAHPLKIDNGGRFWNISSKKHHKSQKDKEIIVLEAQEIGNGASGRAKGMVVPGFQVPLENLERNAYDYQTNDDSIHSLPSIIRSIQSFFGMQDSAPRYSKAVVRELYNATYVALDRLRDIVKRYEIDCDWVESGAVEASIHAVEEKDEEETEEETDYGSRVLTPQQVDQIIGRQSATNDPNDKDSLLYQWGEYDPKCAGVDPLALTVGLANAVEQWGVKIYENAKVAKLDHNPQSSDRSSQGRFALTTKEGNVIHCDHVVLCTGAEAGLSKRLSNSFIPIYTWMAATEPLHNKCPLTKEAAESVLGSVDQTEMKQPFSVAAAPMCGDDHFALNYWRNDNKEDGRLLFGSLCDTYAFPSSFIAWRLRHALSEVYPHLSNVRFDHVWGGKLAVALHGMPIIGRDINYDNDNTIQSEGGVWYNTGFSGHGIVPTALAGSVIANGILGIPDRESNDMHQMQLWQLFHTHFPPLMWNGYPFSRVGAGAVFLVYNLFDWLGKRGVPVPKLLPEIW